jgi:hypothetical protein
MNLNLPALTKDINKSGIMEYHVWTVPSWDGFDPLVKYLQKYWDAEICESDDKIYSRRWVLRSNRVSISLYHDSQIGNFFLREDGINDQTLLEQIEADLIQRLNYN